MVSIKETGVDLFGEVLPSLAEIERFGTTVHCSEANRLAFAGQIEQQMDKTAAAGCLAVGIGLFILGRDNEAVEKLQKADDCREKFLYSAYAHRRLGNFDEAIECLDKARKNNAEALTVALETIATLRQSGRLEQADKEIKNCANFERVSAQYHYELARLREAQGLYDEAMENYTITLELEPDHPKALFHIAFACDLRGDEEAAMDYYKQIASSSPAYISSLLNLAVLYEDDGQYEKAEDCVDKVLRAHPNHARAILFKKDIVSSKTMVYDEEREKKIDLRAKLLDTPISDFELSVRSRNCLKRMGIETLGDLLNCTEADLLSYKNFGETSLSEIKVILDTKNLRLGMAREDKAAIEAEQAIPETVDASQDMLNKPIDEAELSVRTRKCLQVLDIRSVGEMIAKTEAELLGCKNFGVTSLNEVRELLSGFGLSLRKLE